MEQALRVRVAELAYAQDGMLSRRQLLELGVTRWQIIAELKARRWKAHGTQSVCVHTGEPSDQAMRWFAVFEAGPRSAVDGVSALEAAGLKGFESDHVRVSVPRGTRVVRRRGLMVRQTRRLRRTDVLATGLPRVRVEIAAIRAALWAVSDRQAATILAMVVQQRLVTAESLGVELLTVKRHRRRAFIEAIIMDLVDGAQAMGELDFARLCRSRGLPEPDRQVVRRTTHGKAYLDAEWVAFDLVVEIDGIHHLAASAVIGDALRQNAVTLGTRRVLRLPVMGLRVSPEAFFSQVRDGLIAGGWRQAA
jgi:hypothetical protein